MIEFILQLIVGLFFWLAIGYVINIAASHILARVFGENTTCEYRPGASAWLFWPVVVVMFAVYLPIHYCTRNYDSRTGL